MAKTNSNGKLALAIVIMAIVLAGVIAFLACTDGFTNWNKYCQWGHDYDEYGICQRCGAEKDAAVAEYFQIEADESANKPIKLAQIDRKAYSAMGIPASVESAYTLTATLEPSTSDNKRVVWSVEFVNSESAWATGKNAESYVKVQPTVDGSTQATVTCMAAFSEPINVVATSEDNEGATASCLCDYVKRLVGVDLSISTDTLAFGTSYTVNATPQFGEGTIDGEYAATGYRLSLVNEIKNALNGLTASSVNTALGVTYTVAYRVYDSANLNVDLSTQSFSFKGVSAFTTFGEYFQTTMDLNAAVPVPLASGSGTQGSLAKAIQSLQSKVDNTFKEKVTAINGAHMVFTFDFAYTYNGNSYAQTTATANLKFDAETLAIHVISLSLDNDHLVF